MTHLQEFTINFGRLKIGEHEFNFDIDDKFFEPYEQNIIESCTSHTRLTIEKTRLNLMKFHFTISGSADLPCDRCNEHRTYPIEGDFDVLVKLEEEDSDLDNDEIVFLSPDAYEYNVAGLIYDFHLLSIPLKKECVHENHPTCLKIEALIEGGSHADQEDDDEEDPRWNELRKLL